MRWKCKGLKKKKKFHFFFFFFFFWTLHFKSNSSLSILLTDHVRRKTLVSTSYSSTISYTNPPTGNKTKKLQSTLEILTNESQIVWYGS